MSYIQSKIHSDYDSAESIADSDLEDGELRKMLASPLYTRERGENSDSSRRPRASEKAEAVVLQKRGASAQRTQADHSRRESLMSSSSQEPGAFLFLETDFLLELGILHDHVQSRGHLRDHHLKVWRISFHKLIVNSSKESTISTSLIHNIALRWEISEQV